MYTHLEKWGYGAALSLMNQFLCLSTVIRRIDGMYATLQSNGIVRVEYISSHSNHDLLLSQVKFLPLPKDTKDSIAISSILGFL